MVAWSLTSSGAFLWAAFWQPCRKPSGCEVFSELLWYLPIHNSCLQLETWCWSKPVLLRLFSIIFSCKYRGFFPAIHICDKFSSISAFLPIVHTVSHSNPISVFFPGFLPLFFGKSDFSKAFSTRSAAVFRWAWVVTCCIHSHVQRLWSVRSSLSTKVPGSNLYPSEKRSSWLIICKLSFFLLSCILWFYM